MIKVIDAITIRSDKLNKSQMLTKMSKYIDKKIYSNNNIYNKISKYSNMQFKFLIISLAFLLTPNLAHAYIDPGTGSLILQGIIGFIALGITSVTIFWNKIKIFLRKIFKNKSTQNNDNEKE